MQDDPRQDRGSDLLSDLLGEVEHQREQRQPLILPFRAFWRHRYLQTTPKGLQFH